MPVEEIVHIAVAPREINDDLIKKVAAITNKDLYDTRLILSGKIPRIVAHQKSIQTAELTAQNLRNLGFVVMLCNDTELRKVSHSFRAHAIESGQQGVVFKDKNGQSTGVLPMDVFLILEGRVLTYVGSEETVTKRKINLPATVITGGLPVFKQVKEKTGKQTVQTESFVRIYGGKSLEPLVEIFRLNFDYSFLGAEISPSPEMNFRSFVKKIKDIFPKAIYDNRLTDPGGNSMPLPLTTPQEALEINCKLILMYYRAL